jgi:hypothetical protein
MRRRQSFQIPDVTVTGKKLHAGGKSFAPSKPGEPKSLHGIVFSGEIPATLSIPEEKSLSRHSVSSRLSPEGLIKRFQLSDLKLQPPLVLPSKLLKLSNLQLAQAETPKSVEDCAVLPQTFPQNPFDTKEKLNIPNIPPNIQRMHRLRSKGVKNVDIGKGPDEASMLTYDSKDTPSSCSSNNNSTQPSTIFTKVKEAEQSSNGNSGETSPLKPIGLEGGLNKVISNEMRPKLVFLEETNCKKPVPSKTLIVRNAPKKSSAVLSKKNFVKNKRPETKTWASKRPSVKTKVSFSPKSFKKIFAVQEKDSKIGSDKKPDFKFSSLNLVSKIVVLGHGHQPGAKGPSSVSLKVDPQKSHGSTEGPEVLINIPAGNESIRTSKIKPVVTNATKLAKPNGENQKRKAFILKTTLPK